MKKQKKKKNHFNITLYNNQKPNKNKKYKVIQKLIKIKLI